MRRHILTTFLIAASVTSYGQLHFSIDNPNPCPGQPVTFSLGSISGCSNARVLSEADWNIFPVPSGSEVRYNFSAQNGAPGYTSVTITYASFHPTISVHATYACNGQPVGPISDLILMRPPVDDPVISGLDDNIYSGDQTLVAVSAVNALSYSWNLSMVESVSGSVQGAIVSPTSQQTFINWPADFVGVVDVTATAVGCTEAEQTKRVSILTPPSAVFYESSIAPPAHCAGTSMRYRLEVFGGFTVAEAQLIVAGGATNINVFDTKNGVPVEWSVNWISDGNVKVRYSLSDGSRLWADRMTSPIHYDVVELDAGQIHAPSGPFCSPATVVLQLDRQPTGSPYLFQSCDSGDCSTSSGGWRNNDPPESSTFTGISTNTSFRINLTDNRCGTFQSPVVNVSVNPTPSIAVSDTVIVSGGTFDIPSPDIPLSTISVKATVAGVSGASNVPVTQTLVATGSSDGTVVYSITPSKGGCTGETKTVTVTVHPKPVTMDDWNYILTRQPSREFRSPMGLENLREYDVVENIQYFDGLGRPLQNINIRMSPSAHDIVQPIAYDSYGREVRKFLPYVSAGNNGLLRPNAIASEQPEFYQQDDRTIPVDLQPYSQIVFENSPLNRVLKQGAAGSAWQPGDTWSEHVIKREYLLNTVVDSVMRFSFNGNSEEITFHSAGTLYKNKTVDEDNNDMIEFVDKLNRTVCKKVRAGENVYASTYYVYDDIGNLIIVIPPEGARSIITSN